MVMYMVSKKIEFYFPSVIVRSAYSKTEFSKVRLRLCAAPPPGSRGREEVKRKVLFQNCLIGR